LAEAGSVTADMQISINRKPMQMSPIAEFEMDRLNQEATPFFNGPIKPTVGWSDE
jgi:hypothetical protein